MFCKWCGNTIRSTDKKCTCGRETPALSDCGGFYDLKRPWEAETPAMEAAPIPMGSGADMATIRRLQQEKNELRQQANTRNLIMMIISGALLLAFVITLVFLLRSGGNEGGESVKTPGGALDATSATDGNQEQIPDNMPAEVLLGVTVDVETGTVITSGDYDALQIEGQKDHVIVDFLWDQEIEATEPAQEKEPEEEINTPVETAPAVEATNAASAENEAAPAPGDTDPAQEEPVVETAPGQAPEEAPAETVPADTEPVEEEKLPAPVTEPVPGVDLEKAQKLRVTVSWEDSRNQTVIAAKLGWDEEMVQQLGLQIAYGWEFTTDGEIWNYLQQPQTTDEDAEPAYKMEDGALTVYEAWWNEDVEEPTDLQVRCRIVVTAKNGDKVILVVDGFQINHKSLKLQAPQQLVAMLPEEASEN